MIKKIFLILIFFFIGNNFGYLAYGEAIKIEYKVNEDLITNYDIFKEAKYLKGLNKDLVNIDENQLMEFAKNSLIKEKIKKHEIEKVYNVNYESEAVDDYIEDIMKKNGFENRSNFETYLLSLGSNISELRRKLIIEQTWNKMIYEVFKDQIKIDENKMSKTLDDLIKEKVKQKSFKMKEIVFSANNKEDFEKKYSSIVSSIKKIGFKEAAYIHSISNTARNGGEIGWINQNQMSKKILDIVMKLEVGAYSEPINTSGGKVIFQVTDIKEITVKETDKKLELSNIINAEKNRQLNEFSVLHYKKTENKSYVKKF